MVIGCDKLCSTCSGADLGLILTDFLNEGPREQASRGVPGNFF